MNLTQYVEETARTAGATRPMTADESQLICMALGLAGEAGEFADKVKKMLFHDHPVSMAEFTKELGDVMWYWTRTLPALNALFEQNVTHESVLDQNVGKLRTRYPDGFTSEASLARVDMSAEDIHVDAETEEWERGQTNPAGSAEEEHACTTCDSETCREWCEQDGSDSECAA